MARDGRRSVLLTGASGNWGRATLAELRGRDHLKVIALVLDTPKDRAVMEQFADMDNLEIIWGDLTDADVVAQCVRRVDVVLHIGAVVSPLADAHPEMAWAVNPRAVSNIVKAVRALPDPSAVRVVGVGSVAETGNRAVPHHWGRIGDPVAVSWGDEYGQTKVIAERTMVESGLPRWAWLRQTGIFHPGMLEIRDPIMTHSPFADVMEWVSVEDAGRLAANLAEDDVPEEFWGHVYNVGGGEQWRLTNWELQEAIGGAMGVADVRTWYRRDWFALKNFHGQWYTDSDHLESLVHFREDPWQGALERATEAQPPIVRNAGKVPGWIVRELVMRRIAERPRGTLHALRTNNKEAIRAFFGSREAWKEIGDWSTFTPPAPSRTPSYLDHGFDESVPAERWDADIVRDAARFRGGILVSDELSDDVPCRPLMWKCAEGHLFAASPKLILEAGHWCPVCVRDWSHYEDQAEANKFLAQVL
ncbi:Nucleoside-diphosphate-sugar epimerase [Propionibacterium cyclohexanicum]|uniref:Nucleoside-diphosphate-sugar epimerase n=1 Tax=Propionibacterium cyclohexanicum TaxID=64702 RepID=A0A1H9SQU4_9ACTN|nr:NAD(P)-dependent oxidoreductase [Propionibacterium cyclohexanicum]SER87228.1 Nucleoside-diphosphate-sugar epimerase [Propionibacterium cyclohexanicum]